MTVYNIYLTHVRFKSSFRLNNMDISTIHLILYRYISKNIKRLNAIVLIKWLSNSNTITIFFNLTFYLTVIFWFHYLFVKTVTLRVEIIIWKNHFLYWNFCLMRFERYCLIMMLSYTTPRGLLFSTRTCWE